MVIFQKISDKMAIFNCLGHVRKAISKSVIRGGVTFGGSGGLVKRRTVAQELLIEIMQRRVNSIQYIRWSNYLSSVSIK